VDLISVRWEYIEYGIYYYVGIYYYGIFHDNICPYVGYIPTVSDISTDPYLTYINMVWGGYD